LEGTAVIRESATSLREHALGYAAAGVPVFPCVPGGKAPATTRGFHDATTDPDQVRRWWARQPNANIGMPTGARPDGTGIDVLDVDERPTGSGRAALAQARRAGLTDGWIRVVATPSGGLHLHYPGTTQRNGTLRDRHLDFRGQGGYVLLPPSLGQTKQHSRRYEIIATKSGPHRRLDWGAVTALLDPPRPAPATSAQRGLARAGGDVMAWLAPHVATQPEGNRNAALYWAACRAVEARCYDLEPLVRAAVGAGLAEREARRTIRSAQTRADRPAGRPSAATHELERGVAR
jgi:hypothetical protein